MRLQAVLFDLDGTIAETETVHLQCFNEAFQHFGLPYKWTFDEYRTLLEIAGGRERIRHYFEKIDNPPDHLRDLAAGLHKLKNELYVERMEAGFQIRPGVRRLLEEALVCDITCGLTTTTSRVNVDPLLRYSLAEDYSKYFAFLLTGTEIRHKKPDPAIYITARQMLLEQNRKNIIVIEDSHIGLVAARSAGLPVLITQNEFTGHHDFSGAVAVLSDLGDPETPARLINGPALLNDYVDLAYLDCLTV